MQQAQQIKIIGLAGTPCSGKATFTKIIQDYMNEQQYEDKKMEIKAKANLTLKECQKNWKSIQIINNIQSCFEIEIYRKRNFFILIFIDAPLTLRFQRYCEKNQIEEAKIQECLREFIQKEDELKFGDGPYQQLQKIQQSADIIIQNSSTISKFCENIQLLNFSIENYRPKWDLYYIRMAELAKTRSNCMKRAIGAVIVRDNRVISSGFNGTPYKIQNCFQDGCPRCNSENSEAGQGLDVCLCIHAEQNAILEVGRSGAKNATLYSTTFPCITCAKSIIQAGITRLVYNQDYDVIQQKSSRQILESASIKINQVSPSELIKAEGILFKNQTFENYKILQFKLFIRSQNQNMQGIIYNQISELIQIQSIILIRFCNLKLQVFNAFVSNSQEFPKFILLNFHLLTNLITFVQFMLKLFELFLFLIIEIYLLLLQPFLVRIVQFYETKAVLLQFYFYIVSILIIHQLLSLKLKFYIQSLAFPYNISSLKHPTIQINQNVKI